MSKYLSSSTPINSLVSRLFAPSIWIFKIVPIIIDTYLHMDMIIF